MDNIDVINWHCFYGKELMDEFRSIDTDGDGYIRSAQGTGVGNLEGNEGRTKALLGDKQPCPCIK